MKTDLSKLIRERPIYILFLTFFVVFVVLSVDAVCNPRTVQSPEYDHSTNTSEIEEKEENSNIVVLEESDEEYIMLSIEPVPESVSGKLDKISENYGAAAVQVAVIKDGFVRYTYNYGYANIKESIPVTDDTKFRLASLSKPCTAMAVMTLYDDGLIDLDADISNYLGYKVRNPEYPDTVITPRMLMSHTSSIIDSQSFIDARNDSSSVPLQDLLQKKSSYSKNQPGVQYSYSNFGVAVLAAASERIVNEHFSQYAHKRIFGRMGIDCEYLASMISAQDKIANIYSSGKSLQWSVNRQLNEKDRDQIANTYHIYQGNLTVSAKDYADLLCVLMNRGKYKDERILSEKSVEIILSTQFSNDEVNQCLCLQILEKVVPGRRMFCHTGSCYGSYNSFAFDPEYKNGVVVITTGANANKNSSGLYDICADMIREIYNGEIL